MVLGGILILATAPDRREVSIVEKSLRLKVIRRRYQRL